MTQDINMFNNANPPPPQDNSSIHVLAASTFVITNNVRYIVLKCYVILDGFQHTSTYSSLKCTSLNKFTRYSLSLLKHQDQLSCSSFGFATAVVCESKTETNSH